MTLFSSGSSVSRLVELYRAHPFFARKAKEVAVPVRVPTMAEQLAQGATINGKPAWVSVYRAGDGHIVVCVDPVEPLALPMPSVDTAPK